MNDMVVSKFPDMVEVSKVEPLSGYSVRVMFSENTERVIDLEPYLFGPVFEPIRSDPDLFRQVFIDDGALAWPNGADIDTDSLYYDGPPPWAQNIFEHSATANKPKRKSGNALPDAGRAKSKSRSKVRGKTLVASGTRKSKR